MARATFSKVYAAWSIVKWIGVACVLLYFAKARRDAVYLTQNNVNKCQEIYDDATFEFAAKGQSKARWYDFGPCSAAFPTRFASDPLTGGPNLLRHHKFGSIDVWKGTTSEIEYLLYQMAAMFAVFVLLSVFYMIVPFVKDDWSPNMVSVFVLIGSLGAVILLIAQHWMHRLYSIPTVSGVATYYVSIFEPKMITALLAVSVVVPFLIFVTFLVARFAYSNDRKGPELSAIINLVIICGYTAFTLWWLIVEWKTERDIVSLVLTCVAGFTAIETMIAVFAFPIETGAGEYNPLSK